MIATVLKFGGVFALGLLAPVWWTWAISKLTYAVYTWSGSPDRSTQSLLWTSIYVPSLVLGLVVGAIVVFALTEATLKGWLIFFGALLLCTLILGFVSGKPLEYMAGTFGSVGNWFFFVGSAVLPVVACAKKRAG
jgi:hypothetical protein